MERWWTCEWCLFRYGPDRPVWAICATSDRDVLPDISIWYLTTNLAKQQAQLVHVVQLYGLRNWIEQGYIQMKNELGWANFIVHSDCAIRRHWTLVLCALTLCWWHEDVRQAPLSDTPIQSSRIATAGAKTSMAKRTKEACWPRALRAVRVWLVPAHWLRRC